MIDLASNLVSLLDSEIHQYQQLLALLEDEIVALRRADLKQLTRLGQHKQTHLVELRRMADRRQACLAAIGQNMKPASCSPALKTIDGLVPPSLAEPISARRKRLKQLAKRAQDANRRIQTLLHRSLAFVHNSLNLIHGLVGGPARYAKTGKMHATPTNGNVLRRSA
jgi:flagellar biosynthesis/type III secretory pathway chaperone